MGKIGNYAVTRENLIKNENVAQKKKTEKKRREIDRTNFHSTIEYWKPHQAT